MTATQSSDREISRVTSTEELNAAFQNGLVELYRAIFADPPYEEEFTPEEVESFFNLYFMQGVLMLCRENITNVVGFSAAIPLVLEQDIAVLAKKFGIDPETAWYFADLGVGNKNRRQGIAQNLVLKMIEEVPVDTVLMRTSENNIASQTANKGIGFTEIDGMEQFVSKKRKNGEEVADRRIFLKKQK